MSEMSQEDFNEFLRHPILYPKEFKDWIGDYFATNLPKLHVSQVFGFKLLSVHTAADVATAETTGSSAAWNDLTTVGPTLSNLPNGYYLAMFGAYAFDSATLSGAVAGRMSIAIDGSTALSDDNRVDWTGAEVGYSAGRACFVDLRAGNHVHELKAKYMSGPSNTATISYRWLHALQVVLDES